MNSVLKKMSIIKALTLLILFSISIISLSIIMKNKIVNNANAKEFIGKNEVKPKKDLNSINKTFVKKDNKEIKENNQEEDWDSF